MFPWLIFKSHSAAFSPLHIYTGYIRASLAVHLQEQIWFIWTHKQAPCPQRVCLAAAETLLAAVINEVSLWR